MKRESPTASPAEVGALAARMAREAMTPETRMTALAALRAHWDVGAVGRPPAQLGAWTLTNDARGSGGEYVAALGRWAQSVRFVREPLAVGEVVQAPWRTATYRAGDCDDLACACAAFAAVVGLPAAVAIVPTEDGQAHALALVGDRWDGANGRLTHMIDHDGARVAPPDILSRSIVFPVSGGM